MFTCIRVYVRLCACVRVCGEEGMFVCFRARIRVWKYFNKSSAVYTAPDKYKYNAGLSTARVLYGWIYYKQRVPG